MPKKYNKYSNFSVVCATGFGDDHIWDDTELIDQFEEALREWKEERGGKVEEEDDDTDPEEIPSIGPWVEVPVQKYNPDHALKSNVLPAVNDLELINLYDQALLEWRSEREPNNWKKYLDSLANEALIEDESTKLGPWVMVETENSQNVGDSTVSLD